MRRLRVEDHLRKIGVSTDEALEAHKKMLSIVCPNDPEKYQILGNPNNVQPINIAMG